MVITEPLDLKYRPKRFADVLGNHGVVKLLLIRSRTKSLVGRSMMFGGPKGSGKTSFARIVARAIFCDSLEDGEPCGVCPGCKSVDDGSADSFDEFDAATQGTVERMRSVIEDLEYGTVSGKSRLIILDEAHRLSKQSQDALLKAMEDRRIVVILCTTEPHNIKTAIRSRVEEYPVSYPPEQEMIARLGHVCAQHRIEIGEGSMELEALDLIVRVNARCPRTCLTTLQSAALLGPVTVDSVKRITRFGSMEGVVRALSCLSSDPKSAVAEFDGLFDQEGPTWVRDHVLLAISSGMRSAFGAKPTYPVPTDFWDSRGRGWLSTAQALSMLDRPNQADVEAILYSEVTPVSDLPPRTQETPRSPPPPPPPPVVEVPLPTSSPTPVAPVVTSPAVIAPAPSVRVSPISSDKPKAVSNPAVPRVLEVDGVRYSSDESLTSLDHRIEPGTQQPPVVSERDVRVEYDAELVPMTEKEFTRGFLERIRT